MGWGMEGKQKREEIWSEKEGKKKRDGGWKGREGKG